MNSVLSLEDMGLVRVHDRYGRSMFVKRDELDNPKRIQLRLYRRDGARLLQPHTHPWQGHYQTLHRGNICPHPTRNFKQALLLGEPVRYCPECMPNFPHLTLEENE